MSEKWDSHRMDYNSHNGQHLHRDLPHHHNSRNQSFSSALLDAICKSTEVEGGMMAYKRSRSRVETRIVEAKSSTLMRNSRSERKWDEDSWTNNEKFMRGRSLNMGVFNAEQIEAKAVYGTHREFHLSKRSSASMCSSDNESNSSSISCPYLHTESFYTPTSSIRTAKTEVNSHHVGYEERAWKWAVGDPNLHGSLSLIDGNFRSTEKPFFSEDHHAKKKSMSQTGKDSEKPKQPISPGRKLANFLNSLFMAGGTKKAKFSSTSSVSDSNSYDSSERKSGSVYSSSSSVQSRPCLSKTYRGSSNNSGMSQKSVTFYPTSVVVDKADSRPFGEKCLHKRENPAPNPNSHRYPHAYPSNGAYKLPQLEKENHVAAVAAKDIIGKYQQANNILEAAVRTLDKQDEEEEDVASCASSDLFELENLADISMTVYRKELPVYGTTHWETNKAIAKGLIV